MRITISEAERQLLIAKYITILYVAITSLYTDGDILLTSVNLSDLSCISKRMAEMIRDARKHKGESAVKASINVKKARKIWKL